jgi:hypothetical protein
MITIDEKTTLGQLQLELGCLGINTVTWTSSLMRHIVTFYGPYIDGTEVQGYGQTLVEAMDDAFTSLTEVLRSKLTASQLLREVNRG